MKTVPSLVASSTVGIATIGLAFGKPDRSTTPRPTSKKRKAGDFAEAVIHNQDSSSPNTRPGTSLTAITPEARPSRPTTASPPIAAPILRQRASTTKVEINNNNTAKRFSMFRLDDFSSPRDHLEEEITRESISSRGSWMRRLSIIPNSHDNSPRSSVGPDSPSITSFNGSAVPILASSGNTPVQLPPNKLVKRGTSTRQNHGPASTSRPSRSEFPTLRRPATSHQRTITLQQQFREDSMGSKDSFQQTPTREAKSSPARLSRTPETTRSWRLYFDSRPTKLAKEKSPGRAGNGMTQNTPSTSKRVMPDETVRPTLIKPEMITAVKSSSVVYYYDDSLDIEESMEDDGDPMVAKVIISTEASEEPQKRLRRSLSMHFSSPTSWISRSGSLRGTKRNPDGRGGKRYASAPVPSMPGRGITSAHDDPNNRAYPIIDPSLFQEQQAEAPKPSDPFSTSFQSRSRTSSSPLPPLSRLSSFNLDLARLGLSSSSSSAPRKSPSSTLPNTNTAATSIESTGHPSPGSTPYFPPTLTRNQRTSPVTDRTSTLVGSDNEIKGFASGDEDEMDYQSETVYDSLRSGATGSLRSHNPIDSMFEESPPSLNGHAKGKRLSIHEMLNNGTFSEDSGRIIEEDEEMATPVKAGRSSQDRYLRTPMRMDAMETDEAFPSSPPSFCLATKDFARLSLDDDEDDEDWTRDDENDVSNPLSPPSSSLNSRKVSPSFRAALADVTNSTSSNGNMAMAERPRSNLFDWSEPSNEKVDLMGNSPRPRTAHVKQVADIRGGRAIGRRGPSALHIRSQSVPVVPDVAGQRDHSKMIPKFGTWGLGAKGVSEDWDNDFEFDSNSESEEIQGNNRMETSGMLVPPAIQASQASVVGHVGQIREVCLLVEDLKRLRLLAREKGLLDGASASLWKEAEGIIALAVPDEEDLALSPPASPSSISFHDEDDSDERYHDEGPDAEDVSRSDAPFEVLNRHGRPTGYIYDGGHVRRRSVFSPDDDIFGAGLINTPPLRADHLRPPSISPRHSSMKTSSEVARSVMETMHQHRSTSDPLLQNMVYQSPNKMPFDTTSLRDLVQRANNLTRTLSDLIRRADGRSQSPDTTFVRDASPAFTRVFSDPGDSHLPEVNSSPAFTRVFTDTMASQPRSLPRSRSNNSVLSGTIDDSPTRSLGRRMQMMTVA